MRCPKCGYISFDHEEICSGCKKNISKFSKDYSGVVFRGEVPDFLKFGVEEGADTDEASPDTLFEEEDSGIKLEKGDDAELALSSDEDEIFLEEAEEIEFDLGDDDVGDAAEAEEEVSEEIKFDLGDAAAEEASEEIEFDLDDDADEATEAEEEVLEEIEFDVDDDAGEAAELSLGDLDFSLDDTDDDGQALGEEEEPPSLDLSGLDIADLTPPETGKMGAGSNEDISFEELTLESSEDSGGSNTEQDGLPNLEVDIDGMDLEGATLAPAGSATGKKLRPSAKTGTALDDFNIDLGDLVSGKK